MSASLTSTPRACLVRTHSPPVVRRVVRYACAGAFPVLTQSCFDTYALVPPEPSYLVWGYGEIENEIDNLDNLCRGTCGMQSPPGPKVY
jgi:hypothetical protein